VYTFNPKLPRRADVAAVAGRLAHLVHRGAITSSVPAEVTSAGLQETVYCGGLSNVEEDEMNRHVARKEPEQISA
jgi:hypothetical protein